MPTNPSNADEQEYRIEMVDPAHMEDMLPACVGLLEQGDAVDTRIAARELPQARKVAVVFKGAEVVAVGAIKRARPRYEAKIAESSGADLGGAAELGYIAVASEHRGHDLTRTIIEKLASAHPGPLFSTTSDVGMQNELAQSGFSQRGHRWRGQTAPLSLWQKGGQEHSVLYSDIKPLAEGASLKLSSLDEALCRRIEASEKRLAENTQLPFKGLSVSFEHEFLVPPKPLSIWSKKRSACQKADTVMEELNPSEYAAIGCRIVKDGDMEVKLEGNSVPDANGHFSVQSGCIKDYFKFRSKLTHDITNAFPDHRVQRYSEHVHFSFRDGDGNSVTNLDPRFIELLEASLIVHWQAARPLVTSMDMLTDPHPPRFSHAYINEIGTRLGVESEDEIKFIVRRESPENHHYEARRTLPGPDSSNRKLPYSPMLMTQALLASSVDVAVAAYSNPELATQVMAEAERVREHPYAYGHQGNILIQEIAQSPILNHPDSLGPEITLSLAQEMNRHLNAGAVIVRRPSITVR